MLKISLTNVIIALLYPQNTLPLKPKSDVALQLYITTLQERCSAPKACTFFISYCYFDSIQRVKKKDVPPNKFPLEEGVLIRRISDPSIEKIFGSFLF